MRLFAGLSWYDEPDTWLAATISSLTKAGVDELIAIDGAYPHYPGALHQPRSPASQIETVARIAYASGLALTLHTPRHNTDDLLTEVEKRSELFRLFELRSDPGDWILIIDGDEVVSRASAEEIRGVLEANPEAHMARAEVLESVDPYAGHVSQELFRNPAVRTATTTAQCRMWRRLDNMRVEHTHYTYLGDENGETVAIRDDHVGRSLGYKRPRIVNLCSGIQLEHRKMDRHSHRKAEKMEYYQLRDRIGLEKPRLNGEPMDFNGEVVTAPAHAQAQA